LPETARGHCRPQTGKARRQRQGFSQGVKAIRFDPDVLGVLKATGKSWQTRVNDVMRKWLKSHSA
jgi:uncharacterized protein (DUF4415 family)